jgi:acyl dehydratase
VTTPWFNDIKVGDTVPPTVQRLTIPIMQRWVAATETLRRDHYDAKYAIEHDGLPDAVLSGSFSHAYLWGLLFDWVGPDGWVYKLSQKNARMVHPGSTLTFAAEVKEKREIDGLGFVDLELGLQVDNGDVAIPGTATVVLPLRDGRKIPYPFVAP